MANFQQQGCYIRREHERADHPTGDERHDRTFPESISTPHNAFAHLDHIADALNSVNASLNVLGCVGESSLVLTDFYRFFVNISGINWEKIEMDVVERIDDASHIGYVLKNSRADFFGFQV